jgi:hypothetical protein
MKKIVLGFVILSFLFLYPLDAEAKRRRRRRFSGPPPTHPVLLWSRTLSTSTDREQRKIAAFKLSQYSLQIFQAEAVTALTKCVTDPDVEIKVLCTKAMGRAGNQGHVQMIRKVLLDRYENDPTIRNTLVRTFVVRQDYSPEVQAILLDTLKKSQDVDEMLALLKYFEIYGDGSNKFVEAMVSAYNRMDNAKIRSSVVTALSAKAQGQDSVLSLFAKCVESPETTLVLNCLSGLQQQGKKDARAWAAVEKTIDSEDPDVLMASLDVINSLPEAQNAKLARRLVQIIDKMDDQDTEEKAVLALGVCGDHSSATVEVIQKLLEKNSTEEGTRIAAALVLGKQANLLPEKPRETLTKCSKSETSQSLRTACQLGLQELESRKAMNAQVSPPPSATAKPTPAEVVKPAAPEKKAEETTTQPSRETAAATGETKDEKSDAGESED